MAIKQREAVYQVTTEVLARSEVQFTPGVTDVKSVVSSDIRAEITDQLVSLFQEGQVDLKSSESNQSKLQDPKKLRSYVTGLVTNWFNKDPLLNGGTRYAPKSPGSRAGSGDAQIREMKILKKHLESRGEMDKVAKVEAAIQARISEINAEKSPKEEIDVDQLPDSLKDLAS